MNTTEKTSRTTDLAATFEDERYAWTRRRTTRRAGVAAEVVLLAVLLAAALVAAAVDTRAAGIGFAITAVVGAAAFIPLHSMVNLGVRGLFDRREATLDEVQLSLRDRSAAATHWVRVALSLVAVAVAVQTATSTEFAAAAFSVGFVIWFASWLTSTWHLAWTLPDEDLAE